MQSMNQSRRWHSSCVLGDSLYVSGGHSDSIVTCIERLQIDDRRIVAGQASSGGWETLQVEYRNILFLMVPIGTHEILLLKQMRNSAIINVQDDSKEKFLSQVKGNFYISNQFRISHDGKKVFAITEGTENSKLICISKDEKRVESSISCV